MKKELIIALFFVIALSPSVQIRLFDDFISQGSDMEMHIRVINDFAHDLDDVRIMAYIPELGERIFSSRFDVDDKSSEGRFLRWNTNSHAKGDYLVRIVTSNKDFKDVKHRYITIY